MAGLYRKDAFRLGLAVFLVFQIILYVDVIGQISKPDVDVWNPFNFADFFGMRMADKTNNSISSLMISDHRPTILFEKGDVALIGLTRNIGSTSQSFKNQLIDLSCKHHISITILSSVYHHEAKLRNDSCGDWNLVMQPNLLDLRRMGRVERIAFLRDFQREQIRKDFRNSSVVVVVDMDLENLPDPARLVEEIAYVRSNSSSPDVTCPLGLQYYPFVEGYYDTFATILLPDTFVYPLRDRLRQKFMPNENTELVISGHNQFGSFNPWDLMRYIQYKASPRGELRVGSCFGGFAIYRSETFFEPLCNYSYLSDNLMMYANHERRPCEHIAFHKCLREVRNTTIAIQTNLVTAWHSRKPGRRKVLSTARIHSGSLSPDNILITCIPHFENYTLAEPVYRLENGAFTLQINETGQLVLEERKQSSIRTLWTPLVNTARFQTNWYKMFLVLAKTGRLMLIQQVEKPLEGNEHYCKTFDQPSDPSCRITLWQSDFEGRPSDIYNLILGDDGSIQVRTQANNIVWSLD